MKEQRGHRLSGPALFRTAAIVASAAALLWGAGGGVWGSRDSETSVSVIGADARHIARSLRMAGGDPITVCTPSGREYECRLTRIRDELCEAEILSSRAAAVTSAPAPGCTAR